MRKAAQKTDLNIVLPMPTQQTTLTLNRFFTQEETDLLKLGFIPMEMQDKWFIYFEKNVLYFYRSWTGICIFQVFFTGDSHTLQMTHAIVNRDPEQYTETRDERDTEIISDVINAFLLHRE